MQSGRCPEPGGERAANTKASEGRLKLKPTFDVGREGGGDTPKDYTKPRRTKQSHKTLYKAPETLYKDPTQYAQP